MSNRWTLVETSTGYIRNIIAWDGKREYALPRGYELRPWRAGDVIYREPEPPYPDLTSAQFYYMLAHAGLQKVMDGVVAHLDENAHPMFPEVYGYISAQTFEHAKTLEVIGQLGDLIASLYPDADVSESNISASWAVAKEWNQ